jgi:hypothetical protein
MYKDRDACHEHISAGVESPVVLMGRGIPKSRYLASFALDDSKNRVTRSARVVVINTRTTDDIEVLCQSLAIIFRRIFSIATRPSRSSPVWL